MKRNHHNDIDPAAVHDDEQAAPTTAQARIQAQAQDLAQRQAQPPALVHPQMQAAAVLVAKTMQDAASAAQPNDWRRLQMTLVNSGFLKAEDATQDLYGDRITSPALIAAVENLYTSAGLERRYKDSLHWWDVAGAFNVIEARYCGVDDAPIGLLHTLAFGSPIGRWDKSALTYSINTNGCNLAGMAVAILTAAFAQWQAASRGRLTLTPRATGGDIQVVFGGSPLYAKFGAKGGVVGHALPPSNGAVQFDSAETWSTSTPPPAGQISLLAVALHEIGHALGLAHSDNPASIMYPFGPALSTIDAESIEAIQSIYGWLPQRWLSDRGTADRPAMGITSQFNFTSRWDTPYMVWRGVGDDDGLWWSRLDGSSWTPQQSLPNVGSSHGPALASFGGQLLMAWKGVPGDQSIWYAFGSDGNWTPQQVVPNVGTSSRPALGSAGGVQVMAWRGVDGDDSLWWSTFQAGSWTAQQQVRGVGSSDGPTLAQLGNRLYMFWKGVPGDSNAYWSWMEPGGDTIWRAQRVIEYADSVTGGMVSVRIGTSGSLSATTRGDEILLAWKGVDGDSGIWFSVFDGNEFSGQVSVPNVGTSAGPCVIAANNTVLMAWKGVSGDSGIYWSTL